jgi:hypothetical protein
MKQRMLHRKNGEMTMSEFLFIYRGGLMNRETASPEQMQQSMQKWMAWMKELGAKGHLKDAGHPLDSKGKTVKGTKKAVTDGPYAEKDLVGGYSLITAKDINQAVELTSGCPIFDVDGAVEVRAIMAM